MNTFYSYCVESVNDGILVQLKDITYNDLINIEKDDSGNISLISINSSKTNILSRKIVKSTEEILNNKAKQGVKIPICSFLGIKLLSGYGKEIPFKAIEIHDVDCSFDSEFKSSGINQTLHSLYTSIDCKINVKFPFNNVEEKFSTKVLISEAIIVGEVPKVYLNGSLLPK